MDSLCQLEDWPRKIRGDNKSRPNRNFLKLKLHYPKKNSVKTKGLNITNWFLVDEKQKPFKIYTKFPQKKIQKNFKTGCGVDE